MGYNSPKLYCNIRSKSTSQSRYGRTYWGMLRL